MIFTIREDLISTPPKIVNAANDAALDLEPDKSKAKYNTIIPNSWIGEPMHR